MFKNATSEAEQSLSPEEKLKVKRYARWNKVLSFVGFGNTFESWLTVETNDVAYIVLDLNAWVSMD